jgi:cytoskeleton protein RodZ
MNDQSMPDQETTEVNYSFGQRLSSARRALNLTQEQVAAELRLKVGLIKALEEEDYTSLPTQIYIAGYLRNYARLLKIPVEPLLTALDKAQLESPPLITDASHPRKASHSKLMVKLFALVLFVVVVAGIVSWIQSQDFALFSGKQFGAEQTEQMEQMEAKALPALLPEKSVDEPLVSENETPESETRSEPVAEAAAPAVEEVTTTEAAAPVVEEVTTTEAAAPAVEEVTTTEAAAPVVEEVTTTEAVVSPEVVSKPEQSAIVKEGVELVLSFSDDCWTEVKDSRGESLLYNLYRGGQSKRVVGKPPFSIFIGNAAAVAIEYNGQPYDASAHIRRNLARFRLGQADDYKSIAE